ncbi:hypothetical protein ACT7C1_33930 [Bacillus paranthracis]
MVYAELTPAFQGSFRSDLCKVLRYYLEDTKYACVTEDTSIVTDSFVEILMVYFQGSPVFFKWEKMGFEMDRISCKQVLQKIEHAMRQRSSTLKHRNHFYRLLREVGLQEDIPQDFFMYEEKNIRIGNAKTTARDKEKRPSCFGATNQIVTSFVEANISSNFRGIKGHDTRRSR